MTKALLIIFLKAPRLGAVKSRLARGIGAVPAWRFTRTTAATLIKRVAQDPRWDTVIAITPDPDTDQNTPLFQGVTKIPQGHGDLGQRMVRALKQGRPAVLVGGDIPDITADHVARAFSALGRADLVFGPAEDGGFWLVGARTPKRHVGHLFDNVRWSGPHALGDTLANIPPQRRMEMIDTLRDVDTAADFHAVRSRHKSG